MGDSKAVASLQPLHLCFWIRPGKAKKIAPLSQCPQFADFCSQDGRSLGRVGPSKPPTAAGGCHSRDVQASRQAGTVAAGSSTPVPTCPVFTVCPPQPAAPQGEQPMGLPLHMGSLPVTRGCCWHDRGEEYSANCFAAHLKAALDLI